MKNKELTHFDETGSAHMVDISNKPQTMREATAMGRVLMEETTLNHLTASTNKKGDVLSIARIAGIMAAKKTAELIPLCHSIPLAKVSIKFLILQNPSGVKIEANAKTQSQTGVEMEALTAVSISSLTIYDMLKSVDKRIQIADIQLCFKSGGMSGNFTNKKENNDF